MLKNTLTIVGLVVVIGVLALIPQEAAAVTVGGRFVDDNGHVLENGIEAIAAEGVTSGCNPPANTQFCPDRSVTRAEAAAFIARALDLPDSPIDYFIDDNGHVLEPAINRIAHARITTGCNAPLSSRFCPNRRLTRAEFAAFVARAFDLPATSIDYFTDDNGHVLETAINKMAEARITLGCNPPANTLFCPNNTLTRAHAAGFMRRALELPVVGIPLRLANWSAISCSKDTERCSVNITVGAGTSYLIEEGVFQVLPYEGNEEAEFTGSTTTFSLTLDGSDRPVAESVLQSAPGSATRMWDRVMAFSEGGHTLIGEWRWDGGLIKRTTVYIVATG